MRMSLLQSSILLRWSVCNFHRYWFCSPCPPSGIWCVSSKSTNRMLQGTLMITQHAVPTRGFLWAVVMVTGSEVGMSLAKDFFLLFIHPWDNFWYVGVMWRHLCTRSRLVISVASLYLCRWNRSRMKSWTMEPRKTVTRRTKTWTRCLEPGWESWTSLHRLKYTHRWRGQMVETQTHTGRKADRMNVSVSMATFTLLILSPCTVS